MGNLTAHNPQCYAQVRRGVFSPNEKLFCDIYGKSQPNYQVEIGKTLNSSYEVWGNLSYLSAAGKTLTYHTRTHYTQWDLSVGGKYLFPLFNSVRFYLGLGVNAGIIKVKNNSSYVTSSVHKMAIGAVTKTGLSIELSQEVFVDAFVDYLYQKVRFERTHNLGGIKAGLGFGVSF